MFLATASLNGGTKEADESRLLRAVAEAYPTVVSVRVRETLEAVSRITGQLGFALRATTALALIASMLVLAGAIAAGQNARIYDAVVLKTLGADRGRLVRAFALEYGLVGAATSLLALIAGSLAAYGVLIRVMKLDEFTLPLGVALGVLLLGLTVTIVLGLAGTWKVLGESPADRLRSP
jgi:putative ABC transport system permease protein